MFIELDDGKIYRKDLYLMVKTMVSGSDFPLNQSIENIIKPNQLDNLSAVDLCFTTSRCGGTMASWPRRLFFDMGMVV